MNDLIDQIAGAKKAGLYYLSLYTAMTLPDICAGLQIETQATGRDRYVRWYGKYVEPKYPILSAARAYAYRCSLLHQGQSTPSELSKSKLAEEEVYERVLFIEPGRWAGSLNVQNIIIKGKKTVTVDVNNLVDAIIAGAKQFLIEEGETTPVKENLQTIMRRYEDGYPPFIVGVPVIA